MIWSLSEQRTKDFRSGYYEHDGGVPQEVPDDVPVMVKNAVNYYTTKRGYHERSLNSNGGSTITTALSFINAPILNYLEELDSAARREGGIRNQNLKGLVTFDRRTRKDAFYYYKAQWSAEPFVHICAKRFARRNRQEIDIKSYTNQKEAALSVNGRAYNPQIKGSPDPQHSVTACIRNFIALET